MITNPKAKRVLFYGDSLVYGLVAGKNERLRSDERFTGIVQNKLGDGFEIIEEGLRARTLTGENPFFPYRNGLGSFDAVFGSHMPVDMIVVMLGANDCNDKPGFDAKKVAGSLESYVEKIDNWAAAFACPVPAVLIVLPPLVDEQYFNEKFRVIFSGASAKLIVLRQAMKKKATELGLQTLDAADYASPSMSDGIHLYVEDNERLAVELARRIRNV